MQFGAGNFVIRAYIPHRHAAVKVQLCALYQAEAARVDLCILPAFYGNRPAGRRRVARHLRCEIGAACLDDRVGCGIAGRERQHVHALAKGQVMPVGVKREHAVRAAVARTIYRQVFYGGVCPER